jgi:hypothetical protein
MRTIKTLFIVLLMISVAPVSAQTVDEIIDSYIENTGGFEAWNNLESAKYIGSASGQGMDIPIAMILTKDGKQHLTVSLQGQEFVQFSFDGETMWSTNFMTMLPEKNDNETTDMMKKQSKDFPSPFINYKDKGFSAELLGNETMEGIDTYKVQLTQEPVMVDGKEEPNVSYYYFDTENFVPIVVESIIKQGPMKGQTATITYSDYDEVEGLYFPFSMNMNGQPVTFTEIILNPEIDGNMFNFPEVTTETEEKN